VLIKQAFHGLSHASIPLIPKFLRNVHIGMHWTLLNGMNVQFPILCYFILSPPRSPIPSHVVTTHLSWTRPWSHVIHAFPFLS
jgi:hypothetical protein